MRAQVMAVLAAGGLAAAASAQAGVQLNVSGEARQEINTPQCQDRNAPVIFACNGAECWKSYKASQAAIDAGYRQVYWFRGGYPEWSLKGLATASAPELAQKK